MVAVAETTHSPRLGDLRHRLPDINIGYTLREAIQILHEVGTSVIIYPNSRPNDMTIIWKTREKAKTQGGVRGEYIFMTLTKPESHVRAMGTRQTLTASHFLLRISEDPETKGMQSYLDTELSTAEIKNIITRTVGEVPSTWLFKVFSHSKAK